MADHLRVRASDAHRLRGVEDLPGFPVHHPYRAVGGDDDEVVAVAVVRVLVQAAVPGGDQPEMKFQVEDLEADPLGLDLFGPA
jgi:hypothetical protein